MYQVNLYHLKYIKVSVYWGFICKYRNRSGFLGVWALKTLHNVNLPMDKERFLSTVRKKKTDSPLTCLILNVKYQFSLL